MCGTLIIIHSKMVTSLMRVTFEWFRYLEMARNLNAVTMVTTLLEYIENDYNRYD